MPGARLFTLCLCVHSLALFTAMRPGVRMAPICLLALYKSMGPKYACVGTGWKSRCEVCTINYAVNFGCEVLLEVWGDCWGTLAWKCGFKRVKILYLKISLPFKKKVDVFRSFGDSWTKAEMSSLFKSLGTMPFCVASSPVIAAHGGIIVTSVWE